MFRFVLAALLLFPIQVIADDDDEFMRWADAEQQRSEAKKRHRELTEKIDAQNQLLDEMNRERREERWKREDLIKDLNEARDHSQNRREYNEAVTDAWEKFGN